VNIDPQIAAVKAAQGAVAIEQQLLGEAFVGPPAPTSTPGVNATKRLALASGRVVFHKPFSGVHVANSLAYGQTDQTPPLVDPDSGEQVTRADDAERWARLLPFAYRNGDITVEVAEVAAAEPAGAAFHYSAGR
jgi:hypothetical protein